MVEAGALLVVACCCSGGVLLPLLGMPRASMLRRCRGERRRLPRPRDAEGEAGGAPAGCSGCTGGAGTGTEARALCPDSVSPAMALAASRTIPRMEAHTSAMAGDACCRGCLGACDREVDGWMVGGGVSGAACKDGDCCCCCAPCCCCLRAALARAVTPPRLPRLCLRRLAACGAAAGPAVAGACCWLEGAGAEVGATSTLLRRASCCAEAGPEGCCCCCCRGEEEEGAGAAADTAHATAVTAGPWPPGRLEPTATQPHRTGRALRARHTKGASRWTQGPTSTEGTPKCSSPSASACRTPSARSCC